MWGMAHSVSIERMTETVHIALGIVLAVLILAVILATVLGVAAAFGRLTEEFSEAPVWQRVLFVSLIVVLIVGLIFWSPPR